MSAPEHDVDRSRYFRGQVCFLRLQILAMTAGPPVALQFAPATRTALLRPGARLLEPFRRVAVFIDQSLEARLDSERHGGLTPAGMVARGLQRPLVPTATRLHDQSRDQFVHRPLPADDHRPHHLSLGIQGGRVDASHRDRQLSPPKSLGDRVRILAASSGDTAGEKR